MLSPKIEKTSNALFGSTRQKIGGGIGSGIGGGIGGGVTNTESKFAAQNGINGHGISGGKISNNFQSLSTEEIKEPSETKYSTNMLPERSRLNQVQKSSTNAQRSVKANPGQISAP